jgi:hypothetical protein
MSKPQTNDVSSTMFKDLSPAQIKAINGFVLERERLARIDENRIAQRCFDGMITPAGSKFSKCFWELSKRGIELQQEASGNAKKEGE